MKYTLARAIALRLLFGAVSLLFILLVSFLADELAPGDAATILAGEKATYEQVQKLREDMGLNRPWPIRFGEYVGNVAKGDFGRSYQTTREPVNQIIARDLPMTLTIASSAILLAAAIGITLGTIAALKQNRFGDRAVLTISTLGVTIPNFVLAPLLVYVFCLQMDQLPQTWTSPLVAPMWMYLLLPVCILAARPMALLTRLTRASMIETLQQEFIKTAIAKGVPRRTIVLKHALRNAILPVVTAIGTSFGFLLTGSFVVETFFALPGLGREAIQAIRANDAPVFQACILVTGILFILINLVVDILLPVLDPRIREAQI